MFDLEVHADKLHNQLRIAVDVDGVILDLAGHWLKTLNSAFPDAQATADTFAAQSPKRQADGSVHQLHELSVHTKYMKNVLSDDQWWMRQPAFFEAERGLRKLRTIPNARVFALTAPYPHAKNWEGVRRARLEGQFGFDGRDVIFCPSQLKHLIACAILIEDSVANCEDWVANWARGNQTFTPRCYLVLSEANEEEYTKSALSLDPNWRQYVTVVKSLYDAAENIEALYAGAGS